MIISIISLLIGAMFLLFGIVGGEEINILGQIVSALVGLILLIIPLGKLAEWRYLNTRKILN